MNKINRIPPNNYQENPQNYKLIYQDDSNNRPAFMIKKNDSFDTEPRVLPAKIISDFLLKTESDITIKLYVRQKEKSDLLAVPDRKRAKIKIDHDNPNLQNDDANNQMFLYKEFHMHKILLHIFFDKLALYMHLVKESTTDDNNNKNGTTRSEINIQFSKIELADKFTEIIEFIITASKDDGYNLNPIFNSGTDQNYLKLVESLGINFLQFLYDKFRKEFSKPTGLTQNNWFFNKFPKVVKISHNRHLLDKCYQMCENYLFAKVHGINSMGHGIGSINIDNVRQMHEKYLIQICDERDNLIAVVHDFMLLLFIPKLYALINHNTKTIMIDISRLAIESTNGFHQSFIPGSSNDVSENFYIDNVYTVGLKYLINYIYLQLVTFPELQANELKSLAIISHIFGLECLSEKLIEYLDLQQLYFGLLENINVENELKILYETATDFISQTESFSESSNLVLVPSLPNIENETSLFQMNYPDYQIDKVIMPGEQTPAIISENMIEPSLDQVFKNQVKILENKTTANPKKPGGKKWHRCQKCTSKFESKDELESHQKLNPTCNIFVCQICNKVLTNKRNLKNHILKSHSNARNFICDFEIAGQETDNTDIAATKKICGKAFKYKCDLERHRREHTGDMFGPCPRCGRLFNSKGNFKKHVKANLKSCLQKAEEMQMKA